MSAANELEWMMLDLINEERVSRGLDALTMDTRLNESAEDHSQHMLDVDRFSHSSIGDGTPYQRMEQAGFDFEGRWASGENIVYQSERGAAGWADDLRDTHNSLMNSPGHRANILSDTYETIGIGVELGDYKGYDVIMVTQNFALTAAPLQLDSRGGSTPPPEEPVADEPVNEAPVEEPPQQDTPSDDTPPQEPPIVNLPSDDPIVAGGYEVGRATVSQSGKTQWHTVKFSDAIDDAVVVMGPATLNGSQALTVRVKDVTDNGFKFQLDEWDYLDGGHKAETVGWMAVSAGTHELEDGRVIQAGTGATTDKFKTMSLDSAFDAAPVVLASVASANTASAVTVRLDDIDEDSFRFRLQEEEAAGSHGTETVNWIAIEQGSGSGIDAGNLGGVTHRTTTLRYDSDFDEDAVLLANMQTYNGSDTATIRLRSADEDSARLFVSEEQSDDRERSHTSETVGYLAMLEGSGDVFA